MIAAMAAGTMAWALSIFDMQAPLTPLPAAFSRELSPLLSPNASIFLPGSTGYQQATDRWQVWQAPSLDVVVKVTCEHDITETIQYANEHGRPFLAISGGHGVNTHLGRVENGVGIWMRGMNDVILAEDGQSATIGGGTLSGEIVHTLWAREKQTVTGTCECTGTIAPMLGGGHGWLQGRFGLMADNVISMRLVLADGSAITASAAEHADLFWALRGAGHNFGIVTEMQYKVYDRQAESDEWSYAELVFSRDKLKSVFEVANGMIGGPVELAHWVTVANVPMIDPEKVTLVDASSFLLFVLIVGSPSSSSTFCTKALPYQRNALHHCMP